MKKSGITLGLALLSVLALSSCSINFLPVPGSSTTTVVKPTEAEDHTHAYEAVKTVDATCTEAGYTVYSCTVCGVSYTESLPALGHDKSNAVIKEATCMEQGYTTYTCSRCGTVYTDDYKDISGHKGGYPVKENAVAATCTEKGSYDLVTYCKYCGIEMSRETIETDALGHDYDYNVGTVDPTCTSSGWTTGGKCTRCGATTGIGTIPALGHNFIDTSVKEYLDNGSVREIYKCSRCSNTAYTLLETPYSSVYDYHMFDVNSLYYTHQSYYRDLYEKLYDACMTILNSDADYSYDSGKEYCTILNYDFSGSGMTSREAGNVVISFIINNPQFYFIKVSTYYSSDTHVAMVMDSTYFSGSYRKECEENIKQSVLEFTCNLSSTLTDSEKAKAIHDYIAGKIDYQYDSSNQPSTEIWAHNILGVFDNDSTTGGVCECYTKTYQYLSNLLGLSTISVAGISTAQGAYGGHAWNYTKIDSSWYGVDVTWDDQKTKVYYDYFLASKTTMSKEHSPGSSDITSTSGYFQVELPELSATAYE